MGESSLEWAWQVGVASERGEEREREKKKMTKKGGEKGKIEVVKCAYILCLPLVRGCGQPPGSGGGLALHYYRRFLLLILINL